MQELDNALDPRKFYKKLMVILPINLIVAIFFCLTLDKKFRIHFYIMIAMSTILLGLMIFYGPVIFKKRDDSNEALNPDEQEKIKEADPAEVSESKIKAD